MILTLRRIKQELGVNHRDNAFLQNDINSWKAGTSCDNCDENDIGYLQIDEELES